MSIRQVPVSEALRRLGSPPPPPRNDGSGPSKAELYERAKELGIPRRSAMTKDELARAIARREG
jgi:Rho termination factor, N-terminal domain